MTDERHVARMSCERFSTADMGSGLRRISRLPYFAGAPRLPLVLTSIPINLLDSNEPLFPDQHGAERPFPRLLLQRNMADPDALLRFSQCQDCHAADLHATEYICATLLNI